MLWKKLNRSAYKFASKFLLTRALSLARIGACASGRSQQIIKQWRTSACENHSKDKKIHVSTVLVFLSAVSFRTVGSLQKISTRDLSQHFCLFLEVPWPKFFSSKFSLRQPTNQRALKAFQTEACHQLSPAFFSLLPSLIFFLLFPTSSITIPRYLPDSFVAAFRNIHPVILLFLNNRLVYCSKN